MTDGAFAGDFSYGFYIDLLRACAPRFDLRPLRDFVEARDGDGQVMYVRHDVDVCLDAAVRLAEEEAVAGFATTYMFIPTSPLYDIASAGGATRLRRIQELGHEVAIHFDVMTSSIVDPDDRDLLICRIDEQCALISDITGRPVDSVSFHRPLPIFLHGPDRLGERVNAYSQTLMDCYRSDSAGRWRNGNPLLDLPSSRAPIAQLLTHPVWWGGEHQSPQQRLKAFFETRTAELEPAARTHFGALLAETVPGVARG